MSYIESHQELGDHPKTRRFMRLLGIGRHEAIGILHDLWWWAMDYANDGDLSRYDSADIADGAHYEGDPDKLLSALTECGIGGGCGFVETFSDGRRVLHDWNEYGGKLQQAKDREAYLTWLRRASKRDRCEYPDNSDNQQRWREKLEPVMPPVGRLPESKTTPSERPVSVGGVSDRHRTDPLRRGEERRIEEIRQDKTREEERGAGENQLPLPEPCPEPEPDVVSVSSSSQNVNVSPDEETHRLFVEEAYKRNPKLRDVVTAALTKASQNGRTITTPWKWRRGVIVNHERYNPSLLSGGSPERLIGAGNTTNREEVETARRRYLSGIPESELPELETAVKARLRLSFVSAETLCSHMLSLWEARQRKQAKPQKLQPADVSSMAFETSDAPESVRSIIALSLGEYSVPNNPEVAP